MISKFDVTSFRQEWLHIILPIRCLNGFRDILHSTSIPENKKTADVSTFTTCIKIKLVLVVSIYSPFAFTFFFFKRIK